MNVKICVIYSHHKLGDLIWQLPYIKAISDHHQNNVDLILRKKTQGKEILKDLNHINKIYYNNFRKGIYYWIDVLKLFKIFFKNKYTHVYMLDKVNKTAIAAKLAGIKNIIGPGIGNQKKWLTVKNFLDDKDFKLNYSEQSQKLLKLNKIKIKNLYPNLIFNTDYKKKKLDILPNGRKIAFGVDSFEDYKIWYEENFIELAQKLSNLKIFDYIYLICGPDKAHISKKIINLSKKKYFIDCSQKDLTQIITVLKDSKFFLGNNSGPLNLSAALGIKSFGLISNDPVSELKFSKIIPITPDNYIDNIWNRRREGMKKLTVEKVYAKILENLN
jgi:heptosyltransferase-2